MDHWPQLAQLPLTVDSLEYGELQPGEGFGEEMHGTRLVRLLGGGFEGNGEDITLFAGGTPPQLELAGEWTLGEFCERLHALEQWPDGFPEDFQDFEEFALRWRNWGFESAALDLALQQAGKPLHEVLGRAPRPVTYVNSFGREGGDIVGKALARLETYPELQFKLDVTEAWDDDVCGALVATGAIHSVDFKGRYGLPIEHPEELPALYERVLAAFPDATIEDPHDRPEITTLLEPHADRLAYDAPIHTVADLDAQPIQARIFNIKPSRVGRLEDLFALYDVCEQRGYELYGGGMGELGVARGQIQLLASIFSPDSANDIAPPGFNAERPEPGLPLSPLDPGTPPAGFRWR